jgi:hypothetical protein
VLVSLYVLLVIIAVFLFLIVLVIIGMLIRGAIEWLVKGYIAHRHYDLIDRELDRNPDARLTELNIGHVDGDLPWGRPEGRKVDQDRLAPTTEGNNFPSSEPRPKSLPPPTEPDS